MSKIDETRRGKTAPNAGTGISLAEQAYQRIKDKILTLELRPGLFLNESALCELTGIGRMPVHQAIQRLRVERLIEVIPRKGLVVRFDSLHDILALIEARLAMEPEVVALAAQRASPAQLKALRELLKKSKTLTKGAAEQVERRACSEAPMPSRREAFAQIDHAFHTLISEAASNPFLADAQRPLHDRSNMMWHLRVMPEDGLMLTQREHEALYNAILQQDAQGAREAIRAHLLSLQNRILKASA